MQPESIDLFTGKHPMFTCFGLTDGTKKNYIPPL